MKQGWIRIPELILWIAAPEDRTDRLWPISRLSTRNMT